MDREYRGSIAKVSERKTGVSRKETELAIFLSAWRDMQAGQNPKQERARMDAFACVHAPREIPH
jgi:hypothetical protein